MLNFSAPPLRLPAASVGQASCDKREKEKEPHFRVALLPFLLLLLGSPHQVRGRLLATRGKKKKSHTFV